MNFAQQIKIDSDVETVWKLITEQEKIKIWNPCFISETPIDENQQVGVGFKSKMLLKENGKETEYAFEMTDYNVNERLAFKLEGGNLGKNPMHISHILENDTDSTVLTQTALWEPRGVLLRLMSPIISRVSMKKVRKDLEEIKKLAETAN